MSEVDDDESGGVAQLTAKQIALYFALLARDIRASAPAAEHESAWYVAPGSPFVGDDRKTAPYQVSHSARALMGSSMDHLEAVVDLIETAGVLRPMAPFTLIRGSLETASAAVWMMAPSSRTERVSRRLRLALLDLHDGRRVTDSLGLTNKTPEVEVRARIAQLASTAGVGAVALKTRPTSTEMVEAAHTAAGSILNPAVAWRVCSGLAHGRQWPSLSFLTRSEVARQIGTDDVATYRVSAGLGQVVWALAAAIDVSRCAARLYRARSGATQ